MNVEWLKDLATPAIAIAGVTIACAQLRLADIRLTHDLFDRRYKIFAAARDFIQQVCQKQTVTAEERQSFYYTSADAVFVLNRELVSYLEKLRTNGAKAAELHEKIGVGNASPSEIQQRVDVGNWVASQINDLTQKFKPVLRYERRWSTCYLLLLGLTLVLLLFLVIGQTRGDKRSVRNDFAEIFHLRSECAALGQKILDSHPMPLSTGQYEVSHYEPLTNRCYVKLDRISLESSASNYSRLLFDGQTGESLTFVEAKNTNKTGRVAQGEVGWDKANQYIDAMMADDRKQ